MAHLTIYKDNRTDVTEVSNRFIDEYMKEANDAQLKVYLYLTRMLAAGEATSVSDIADQFNHTERDVLRALSYWEAKGLLDLEYDASGNLTGIHMRDLGTTPRHGSEAAAFRTGSSSVTESSVSESSAAKASNVGTYTADTSAAGSTVADASAIRSSSSGSAAARFPAAVAGQEQTAASSFRKPSYSADQLKEFQSRDETAQLLFIAQSYIGRPLTPGEMKSVLFIMDELHFSEDLVDYLLQYCVDHGKKDFRYIEKVAVSWAEQGITTLEQASKISTRYDRNVYVIMNQLGKSGSPTDKELEFINRWTKEYSFSNDIIFEACERTVLATDKHRFEYADSILREWHKENVRRKSDIVRIDEVYRQRRKNSSAGKTSDNRFNRIPRNEYNFDELEKELISN